MVTWPTAKNVMHIQSMKLRTWSSLMTLSHLNPSRQLDMHCSSMSDWTCTVHCSILLEAISQKELQWFQTPVDRAGRGRTGQRSLCRTGLIWLMVVMKAAHCYSSVVASWLLHARATTSVIVLEIVTSPFCTHERGSTLNKFWQVFVVQSQCSMIICWWSGIYSHTYFV